MLPYWLLFAFAAIPAFEARDTRVRSRFGFVGLALALAMIFMVGMRFRVGADWTAYVRMYHQIAVLNFSEAITYIDPSFAFLNYIVANVGVGFWAVNALCAVIFVAGLFRFAFALPNPWLAIVTSIPYLVIVVAMGYTRQGVALGCMMFGLAALSRDRFVSCVIWVLVAATFHKTAILVIPLVGLAYARHRALTTTAAAILLPVGFYLLVANEFGSLMSTYVDNTYGSQGAVIRVFMVFLPASIFLLYHRRFQVGASEKRLYVAMSILAILTLPAVLLTDNTTLVDRLALYLLPLQLLVASWLPVITRRGEGRNPSVVFALLLYAASIQFVWLNYASHANDWLPYRVFPVGESDAI